MILLIAGLRFILYFHPCEMITLKINITKALIVFPFFCIWLPFFFARTNMVKKFPSVLRNRSDKTLKDKQRAAEKQPSHNERNWDILITRSRKINAHKGSVPKKRGYFSWHLLLSAGHPPPFNGPFFHPFFPSLFLAVQDSSIGDIVTHSLTH